MTLGSLLTLMAECVRKKRGRRKARRGLGDFVVCTVPRPRRWHMMGCLDVLEYSNWDKIYSPPSIDAPESSKYTYRMVHKF
jgi:hypothetical protein